MLISPANISEQDKRRILGELNRLRSALSVDIPFTMPLVKFRVRFYKFQSALMGTNGFELFIDPEKWDEMTTKERLFVLYHEWSHVVNLHSKRMNNKKPRIWNFATDFSINAHITNDTNNGMMTAPDGMLYDSYYNGWFSEKIYEDLRKGVEEMKQRVSISKQDGYIVVSINKNEDDSNVDSSSGPSNSDNYNEPSTKNNKTCSRERAIEILARDQYLSDIISDDLLPSPQDSETRMKEKELIMDILRSAELHKKIRGKLPSEYEEAIKRLRRSQVPWQNVLHSFFKEVISASMDRSFSRPKKWGWLYNIVLPSEIGIKKLNVVLIVDTSGSMSVENFEQVTGEIQKLLPLTRKLTLISADAAVHEKVSIRRVNEIIGGGSKFRFKGRGGTDFVPALEAAAKLRADVVIYYTDGYGNFGTKPSKLRNILWILTESNSPKPPFGKFIILE